MRDSSRRISLTNYQASGAITTPLVIAPAASAFCHGLTLEKRPSEIQAFDGVVYLGNGQAGYHRE